MSTSPRLEWTRHHNFCYHTSVSSYLDEIAAEIRAALPEGASPPPDSGHLFVLYALLTRVKGESVTASDVHDAWSAWIQQTTPDHPALVPYDALDAKSQSEDEPYVRAIRSVAMMRGGGRGC